MTARAFPPNRVAAAPCSPSRGRLPRHSGTRWTRSASVTLKSWPGPRETAPCGRRPSWMRSTPRSSSAGARKEVRCRRGGLSARFVLVSEPTGRAPSDRAAVAPQSVMRDLAKAEVRRTRLAAPRGRLRRVSPLSSSCSTLGARQKPSPQPRGPPKDPEARRCVPNWSLPFSPPLPPPLSPPPPAPAPAAAAAMMSASG